jgi:lipoate-protein ligase A
VIAPESFFPRAIVPSYQHVGEWIISGLKELGIEGKFAPINDIQVGGKKISGNAQTRRKGVALIHGTLLFDVDPERMFSFINVPDEKIKDKMIASVKDRVVGMKSFGVGSREEGYAALKKGFLRGKEYVEMDLTRDELNEAEELVEEKYSTPQWIAQR